MAMASSKKVVLGSIAFAVFWVLAVFPAVPFLPIGRTAGSLLGAMLMVMFRVITPTKAYSAIDLPILGLLFGTMVVSVYLERADMFKYLAKLLSWKSKGPLDLLWRISLISAISSAFFTNDTSCVVLTEFVLKFARQHNLPPHPFLLALASSANIGSSTTPIGNPQNLVIALQSKISFGKFVLGILPAMLLGLAVNVLILTCMYWRSLSPTHQNDEEDRSITNEDENEGANSHRFSPATSLRSTLSSQHCNSRSESIDIGSNEIEIQSISIDVSESATTSNEPKNVTKTDVSCHKREGNLNSSKGIMSSIYRLRDALNSVQMSRRMEDLLTKKCKRVLWKTCVYLVTIGMFLALLMGVNMSWTAITTALVLVVLDFQDAQPCLDKVSYSLLVFFTGMFITVHGFIETGITNTLWDLMEPHAKVDHVAGITVLALIILVMSNVVSNVPTVLLLGVRVAASAAAISTAEEKKAWLILAWVSTVAGNLSLLGSAANLIVCEQARRAPNCGYNVSFWAHLKFGVPSTIIVTTVGLTLIR